MTKNEIKILKLAWKENRPLTRAEILKGTQGRNWNPASIHLILNSMISKGVLRVTDDNVKYGRTYEANISKGEYLTRALTDALAGCGSAEAIKAMIEVNLTALTNSEKNEIKALLDGKTPQKPKKKK